VLLRITVVGILWSVLFIEGVRVILMTNWHFDIFRLTHWQHAWNLWRSGWVIDETKEWAFLMIIFAAIPVWITIWAALSIINWENLFRSVWLSIRSLFNRLFKNNLNNLLPPSQPSAAPVSKKSAAPKSKNPHYSLAENTPNLSPERRAQLTGIPYKPGAPGSKNKPAPKPAPKEFSHSLFEISDDDTSFDFDLFEENTPETKPTLTPSSSPIAPQIDNTKPAPRKKRNDAPAGETKPKNYHSNSTFEVLKQKGYEIISGVTLNEVFIDFVGISSNSICLCLNDKEIGDWLADEERFNDEEPLWFSESSHRISPVRKIAIAQTALNDKLAAADLKFKVNAYVIEQIGNIINAEDMFDIWKDLHINVTRIDRGTPKEIPLFAKKLDDADGHIDKAILDKLKKLLRNNDN